MANRFYNVPLGAGTEFGVAEGSSDTAGFVALRVTYDATGATKLQVLQAIEALKAYINRDTFPPV